MKQSYEEFMIENHMKPQLKKWGNDLLWNIIDHLEFTSRLESRRWFFLAGGIVPEIDLKDYLKEEGMVL